MPQPPARGIGFASVLAVALGFGCWAAPRPIALAQAADQPIQAAKKYALQVGCTEYPYCASIPNLTGPSNDIPLLAKLLKERFGFPEENIKQLVGWPADEKKRPTCANIFAAFDDLIAKADEQTQIVIQLCGHGTQVPIPEGQHPLDPKNYEPDGLDEVFLPADVEKDKDGRLKNHILDDQMGVWLDKLCDKGAAVWIIFDCCHSGTMTRGAPGPADRERSRAVSAVGADLVKKADWDAAVKRGEDAVKEAQAKGLMDKDGRLLEPGGFNVNGAKGKKGSMVAFYGAQSFETAPELLRPADAPRDDKNWYGLLTWTLVKTLEGQSGMLTYRELAQVLLGQYASERGGAPPTPFAEGDMDREVLGLKTWPARSALVLKKENGSLSVTAGACQGLTEGSILAVYPPFAKDGGKTKEAIGYLKVTHLEPTAAGVDICGYGGKPTAKTDDLPDMSRCEILSRDFGDVRIRVAIGKTQNPADAKLVQDVADRLSKDVKTIVKVVPNEAEAQWILTVFNGQVQLRESEGRPLEKDRLSQASDAMSRVFAVGGGLDPVNVQSFLERDLQRIFTSQNMWRVAGSMGDEAKTKALGLKLEIKKIDARGKEVGPLNCGEPLAGGQRLRFKLRNTGPTNLWVRILIMDSFFGITVLNSSIEAGDAYEPGDFTIEDKADSSFGKEGFIVLAGPLGKGKVGPDLTFLNQANLTKGAKEIRDIRSRALSEPASPFDQLFVGAALGTGTRSLSPTEPTNPTILSFSWVTLAPKTTASK